MYAVPLCISWGTIASWPWFFQSVAVRSEARESTRVQSALNRSLPGWRVGMYGIWACQQLLCAFLLW